MRIGRFSISDELLTGADLDGLVRVFAECALVPIKIEETIIREMPHGIRVLDYTALSPYFDDVEVPPGEKPPFYFVDIWSEYRAGVRFVSRARVRRNEAWWEER